MRCLLSLICSLKTNYSWLFFGDSHVTLTDFLHVPTRPRSSSSFLQSCLLLILCGPYLSLMFQAVSNQKPDPDNAKSWPRFVLRVDRYMCNYLTSGKRTKLAVLSSCLKVWILLKVYNDTVISSKSRFMVMRKS